MNNDEANVVVLHALRRHAAEELANASRASGDEADHHASEARAALVRALEIQQGMAA
jgi:DNA-directed RNA polymerase specialized sigma24 family protein